MTTLAFNNPRVQQLRRLVARRAERRTTGLFVVEGPVLVAEAVRAGWTGAAQFVVAGTGERGIEGAGDVFELAEADFGRVASTESPQQPIAIVRMPDHRDVDDVLAAASFVVVLDRISDPGNFGTILRSAEAAGVDAVVVTPGSVDPYNPKAVRASAGALFHVPVIEAEIETVGDAGLSLLGTTSHGRDDRTVLDHTEADLTGRIAIAMGNEASGLPEHWTDHVGPIARWLTIRHRGRSESLNVAMATTVLAFEAARQRQP